MKLSFELSMPGKASWNGKWSGDGKLYAVVESFSTIKRKSKASLILESQPFYYHWPDGWCAKVSVRQVDNATARSIKTKSQGFCGYEWMVVSILERNKILADHEVEKQTTI